MSKHQNTDKRVPIELDNPSIERIEEKCILCGNCRSVCKFKQAVYGNYKLEETNDTAICIHCGQCANVCPTGAIREKNDYEQIKEILKKKENIVIFQTSPSIRVALGEEFNQAPGINVEEKIVTALKKLGASYVFDTTFGADLTIMEEATELVDRIKNKKELPQFTSCCPAWIKYVEMFYPEYIPNISSVKSPILMQGAMIKTYFAEIENIDAKNIINVAVTPCTAKKYEIQRPEMNKAGIFLENEQIRDMDYIITTRELAAWLKEENIDFNQLEETKYDKLMSHGTGAGIIFGATGGVMEAAARTAHYLLTGKENENLLEFAPVRGLEGIKEATLKIQDTTLSLAVVSGTANAKKLLQKMKEEEKYYDFIEVMACVGGCIAGGGQPKHDIMEMEEIKQKRSEGLYKIDQKDNIRYSHQNPEIIKLYQEFLQKPGSRIAKQLLHTSYQDKSSLLKTEECI